MNSGSQGTFLDGSHSAIFLLGSGSLTTSPGEQLPSLLHVTTACSLSLSRLDQAVSAGLPQELSQMQIWPGQQSPGSGS